MTLMTPDPQKVDAIQDHIRQALPGCVISPSFDGPDRRVSSFWVFLGEDSLRFDLCYDALSGGSASKLIGTIETVGDLRPHFARTRNRKAVFVESAGQHILWVHPPAGPPAS